MCGIVGYVGKARSLEVIYSGLKKLEYRGYDSSGIAVFEGGKISLAKSVGKLSELAPHLESLPQKATSGIGHTRWATHGEPSTDNAHPHLADGMAIIHNGIIENYQELKRELMAEGVVFKSQTDTEVMLHVIRREVGRGKTLGQAMAGLVSQVRGAFAIAVLWEKEPDSIFLAKLGSPLAVGYGKGENFFASDALALVDHTKTVSFLEDGEFAKVTKDEVVFWDFAGKPVSKIPMQLNWTAASADKKGYRHYMLKEIHEQPRVIANTVQRLTDLKAEQFHFDHLGLGKIDAEKIKAIHIVGCGTAYLAGVVGQYALEPWAKVPVMVELASEFRYRKPYISQDTLVIAITQSGETADTLASVKYAKERGCQLLAVCNVEHSSIPRECDATIYMDAGPEIGVASTKAFTSMVLCLYTFAVALAEKRKVATAEERKNFFANLRAMPALVDKAISQEVYIDDVSGDFYQESNCLFIGRGISFPIAIEGALKLKEISYIHAEGYAGGELKHGPIALIDQNMTVVAIVPQFFHREKMISNIEEVKARKGRILALGAHEDEELTHLATRFISVPQIQDEVMQSILSVIPLQLFAYYAAVRRGTDVDQPRNLAKSVTVE